MRGHTRLFRLAAAVAITGIGTVSVAPPPALAQATTQADPGRPADPGDPPARVGRLARLQGTVSFHTADDTGWSPALANYPVSAGQSFWTEPGAEAALDISASHIVLAGGTEISIDALDDAGLRLTEAQGAIYLRLRDLSPDEAWSVQTPRGLVTLATQGRYAIAAGDLQAPTAVTVLEGAAEITGPGLSLRVEPGQTATVTGTDTLQGSIGPLRGDPFLAAQLDREKPPPPPAVPPPPLVAAMPGGDALSRYGTWGEAPEYGPVWYPPVSPAWVPYREGRWAYVAPWGWTWIDDAPWGFAPSHYGRWAQIGGRWGWVPGHPDVAARPVYAPALVAFLGIGAGVAVGAALASRPVGWVPLGPREPYHPWYRASDRHSRAVNVYAPRTTTINNTTVVNTFVNRGAATMVPANAMAASRPIRQAARAMPPAVFAAARPLTGQPPVQPTAATAGVTPGMARHLNPTAPQGGFMPRPAAPGPAIHAPGAPVGPSTNHGVMRPPPLTNPAALTRPIPTVPPSARPAGPGPGQPPRPVPPLATPGPRPGPAMQPMPPGGPGYRPQSSPASVATPALRPPGPAGHAGPPAVGAMPPPRTPSAAPAQPFPAPHGPPSGSMPPASRPPAFAAPAPQVVRPSPPAAPPPQFHAAPAPAPMRPPPTQPGFQVPPAPQFHAPPAPQVVRPSPPAAPPPQFHAAPAPAPMRPPPAQPSSHAPPPPQAHASPPPQHAAPPPSHQRDRRPGER